MSGTDTGSTVLDWLVCQREVSQVESDHFWLDFNLVEGLAVVDTDDGADHLWNDDHVAQVSLDNRWLLIWRCFLLGFAQLLDQGHRLALQAAREASAGSAVHQLAQLLVRHVQELIQIDSAVCEFSESTLLAHLLFRCNFCHP